MERERECLPTCAGFFFLLFSSLFSLNLHLFLSFSFILFQFAIGKFINIFLAFVLVCLILYYLVVLPTMHLQEAVNPKESRRPCPKCLEDIAAGAERCPHCTSVVPIAARLQARMDADVTGEIREDLEEVRNNGSSYFSTLKSWIPGTGGSGGAGAGASAKGEP